MQPGERLEGPQILCSESTKDILLLAGELEDTHNLGGGLISSRILCLAVIHDPSVQATLEDLEVLPEMVWGKVTQSIETQRIRPENPGEFRTQTIKLDPMAQIIFDQAQKNAREVGAKELLPYHILLALTQGTNLATSDLTSLGVTEEKLRDIKKNETPVISRVLAAFDPDQTPQDQPNKEPKPTIVQEVDQQVPIFAKEDGLSLWRALGKYAPSDADKRLLLQKIKHYYPNAKPEEIYRLRSNDLPDELKELAFRINEVGEI